MNKELKIFLHPFASGITLQIITNILGGNDPKSKISINMSKGTYIIKSASFRRVEVRVELFDSID